MRHQARNERVTSRRVTDVGMNFAETPCKGYLGQCGVVSRCTAAS